MSTNKEKISTSVVFCIDCSGSMGGTIQSVLDQTSDFAGTFVGTQSWQYKVGVVEFGGGTGKGSRVESNITTDKNALINSLSKLDASGAYEDVANALVTASNMLKADSSSRKAIILWTDENFQSYDSTYQESVSAIRGSGIEVFMVVYSSLVSHYEGYIKDVYGNIPNKKNVSTFNEYTILELLDSIRQTIGYGVARIGDEINENSKLKISKNSVECKMYINNVEVALDGASFKGGNSKLEGTENIFFNNVRILKHNNSDSSNNFFITTSSDKVFANKSVDEDKPKPT